MCRSTSSTARRTWASPGRCVAREPARPAGAATAAVRLLPASSGRTARTRDRPLRLEPNPGVANKFPRLTEAFFRQRGVSAEIIELSGSVELAPLIDLADLIVDLVQSGQTFATTAWPS